MSKTIVGARSKVFIDNQLVGIFDSCTISSAVTSEPIYILGSHVAQENAITAMEIVNVNCSGWRSVGQGKHILPKVPKVQDLLNFEPFTMTVVDRQTGQTLETITQVTPGTNNTNYNARATSKVNVSYVGIINYNEDGEQSENASAASLP